MRSLGTAHAELKVWERIHVEMLTMIDRRHVSDGLHRVSAVPPGAHPSAVAVLRAFDGLVGEEGSVRLWRGG